MQSNMTTSEVARLLGVATSTVQIWMESGAIESWKTPGGHRRTRLSLVQGLLHGKDENAHLRPAASTDKEFLPQSRPGLPGVGGRTRSASPPSARPAWSTPTKKPVSTASCAWPPWSPARRSP
jgi:excisionase family DNA binding protein